MARDIHQWINDYGISHQNSTNKKIHWICVPAIMFTLLGLLSLVKFNLGEFRVNLVYILIGFITGCLVIKSKSQINFSKFKIFIFISGFILIIFSEGSSNILNYFNLYKSSLVFIPFILILFLYLTIIKNKKVQTL